MCFIQKAITLREQSLKSCEFKGRFAQALARRSSLSESLQMYRLFDGSGDDINGLFIDKLGSVCLVHILEGEAPPGLQLEIEAEKDMLLSGAAVDSVYLRQHLRDPKGSSAQPAKLLAGLQQSEIIVAEHGLQFRVRPEANINAGIFLDTRELRRILLEQSRGKRVLNTFCFTGSLGIAAFAGGASEVVQVDSSKSVLTWAKDNFELNSALGTGKMRFILEDCLTFIRREARRIREGISPYGLVILDPPSFGRAGSKVFSLDKDLPELVAASLEILAPEGSLSLTVNSRALSYGDLEEVVYSAADASDMAILQSVELQPPKIDFNSPESTSIAMKGLLFTLKRSGR